MTTTMRALVPLPIPRTSEAPMFDGSGLTEFLSILKQHGACAGLTDDELTPYILQYCTEDVKRVLRYSKELKPTAKDWAEAVEEMKNYYASEDQPARYSVDDLRQFCNETSAKPPFESRSDVEVYMGRFREISGSLLEDSRITEDQVNLYFVTGIPQETFKIVDSKLPQKNRVITSPPSIKEVRKILNALFMENSLQSFARQNFMEQDLSSAPGPTKSAQKAVRFGPAPAAVPASMTPQEREMEEIRSQLERLSISNAELLAFVSSKLDLARPPTPPNLNNRPTTPENRRCFVCGQTGTHRLGWKHCPTTWELNAENLISIDSTGRLMAKDGSELPATRDTGGVAAVLRRRASEARPAGGSTASVAAQYNGYNALGGNVMAVSADDDELYAEPALRSGRDTTVRHDPYAKPPGCYIPSRGGPEE
ncbi:hypothetical protein DFH07DRAFT_966771 [Mycena maculata]|uniref:DUF4100 domain-containing protein n=1 Tax=Mycena maculata TaxID=230809 RepID=A0AAD7MXV2_9AGAR|nr:hypothetical protein DFH07DRAFT_966771 [Mycena maculata]